MPLFAALGVRVACVAGLSELAQAIAAGDIHAILLEETGGYLSPADTLSVIRSHEFERRRVGRPVVLLSSDDGPEADAESFAAGFTALLPMPIREPALADVLAKCAAVAALDHAFYSEDAATMDGFVAQLFRTSAKAAATAGIGWLGTMEAGAGALLRDLRLGFLSGDAARVREAACRLADVAQSVGAHTLATNCHGVEAVLDQSRALAEIRLARLRAQFDATSWMYREILGGYLFAAHTAGAGRA